MNNNNSLNDVVVADAQGVLHVRDVSTITPTTYWTGSGNNIYSNNSGNVGIGINSPNNKLHIRSTSTTSEDLLRLDNDLGSIGAYLGIRFSRLDGVDDMARIAAIADGGNTRGLIFETNPGGGVGLTERVRILGNGNVGIGTGTPSQMLDVNGLTRIRTLNNNNTLDDVVVADANGLLHVRDASTFGPVTYWTGSGNNIYNNNSANVGIGTNDPDGKFVIMDGTDTLFKVIDGQIRIPGNGITEGIAFMGDYSKGSKGTTNIVNGIFRPAPNNLGLVTGSQERLRITDTGDIGIGTITPAEKLDVDGGIRVGFSSNNNDGTIRWTGSEMEYNDGAQWLPFQSNPLWTENGLNISNTNSGNIGIGTPSPIDKLTITDGNLAITDDFGEISIGSGPHLLLRASPTTNSYIESYNNINFLSGRNLYFDIDNDETSNSAIFRITKDNFSDVLLYIQENGRVGIGTDTPTHTLDIAGDARIELLPMDNSLNNIVVADPQGALYLRDASTLGGGSGGPIWVENGPDIYNTNPGFIGIGTVNPLYNLDIRGVSPTEGAVLQLANDDESHFMRLFGGRNGDPNPFILWQDGDPLRFATSAGGFTEQMRIDVNGNVGIGTTNPQRNLHISDVMRLEPRTGAPPSPSEGDLYVNSTDHHIYCYLNGIWKQLD